MIPALIVGAIAAIAAGGVFRSKRKTTRTDATSGARTDTKAALTDASNLILDLEPRVTIANDPALKHRFADASKEYSEVLIQADKARTGHEIADLRLQIAESRWRLDVIAAELDGEPPPPQPFSRNTDGTAWDSTRGTGPH
jgi:type II secretory pathway pseudopilin PulG